MPMLEAEALPVRAGKKQISTARAVERGGVERGSEAMRAAMKPQATPRVLLLGNPQRPASERTGVVVSLDSIRTAALRAEVTPVLLTAANRREFLDHLRSGSADVILAATDSLPDLELSEAMDRARSARPPIPVIVTGEAASRLSRAASGDLLPLSDMSAFPAVLACALQLRQAAIRQAQAQEDLERTAVTLRENQKLITLGRLAASIAHEINNPLESVTNLLYLIGEEQEMSPSARGYLALARRELDRVAQISRQTLNFSRETTNLVRTHIRELLEEVLSLYSRRIMEKNLRVQRQYDCAEEAVVYPGEMRQVLSNLVTNAVEASSPNGRLRVRVRCTRSWSDPGVRGIRISIGDNGSGIAPDVQRRLGEPFFTTKGQRGTGLGLWVTRTIVQRYGGEIQLRSSVDPQRHGTVFSIFLPTNLRPQMVDRPSSDPPVDSTPRSNPTASSRSGCETSSTEAVPLRRVRSR